MNFILIKQVLAKYCVLVRIGRKTSRDAHRQRFVQILSQFSGRKTGYGFYEQFFYESDKILPSKND